MNIIYEKDRRRVIDSETGVVLSLTGYPDDADMGLEYSDPAEVNLSPRMRKFHLAADFIFAERDPLIPSKPKVLGFRVRHVAGLRANYYKSDDQKYARAREFIVLALSAYIRETGGVPDPRIELA